MPSLAAAPLSLYLAPWFGIVSAFLWALFWRILSPVKWSGHHNFVEEVFVVGSILGLLVIILLWHSLLQSRRW